MKATQNYLAEIIKDYTNSLKELPDIVKSIWKDLSYIKKQLTTSSYHEEIECGRRIIDNEDIKLLENLVERVRTGESLIELEKDDFQKK